MQLNILSEINIHLITNINTRRAEAVIMSSQLHHITFPADVLSSLTRGISAHTHHCSPSSLTFLPQQMPFLLPSGTSPATLSISISINCCLSIP